MSGCREITEARPVLPKPGSEAAFVQFKNTDKQYKAPFVIYADFEALTVPVSTDKPSIPRRRRCSADPPPIT